MNSQKCFKQIIEESSLFREKEYISFFFEEIASLKNKTPIYKKIFEFPNTYLSIVKDSSTRILDNKKGKLMERSWRNTIFYFVDKKTYIKWFGTNNSFPSLKIIDSTIEYDGNMINSNTKNPNDPKVRWEIFKGFQNTIFNYFKENKSSWFVRSYVYFVLVLCDKNSSISEKDFNIYYWNTNYAFKQTNNKKNIFNNVSDSYFVSDLDSEISLIEMTNRDAVDCVKAYNGDLDFRNQTEENFDDIKKDIDDGVNFILVRGAARTGKTILAMRILGNYPDSKLLIMNYHFYLALNDSFKIQGIDFPEKRIFHHDLSRNTGCWIQNKKTKRIIPTLDFLIVDEAQRLALVPEYTNGYIGYNLPELDELNVILNNPNQKTTILLGDDNQKINPAYDEGFEKIHDMIRDKKFTEYNFKKSTGVPPEILDNIRYLLDMSKGGQVQPANKFSFSITNDNKEFFDKFLADQISKKHFLSIGLRQLKGQCIELDGGNIVEFPSDLNKTDFPYLFNSEVNGKYLLSTYEVISREIESVYLYIPEKVVFDERDKKIRFSGYHDVETEQYLLNHIYTLMTRATMKLNILCKNEKLYNFFKEKINCIEKVSTESLQNDEMNEQPFYQDITMKYDYDIFIAYHGTTQPNGSYAKAKAICDFLKNQGYKVFLNDYSFNSDDSDLGFNQTKYVIERSEKFLLVFNDSVPRDENGMMPRKNQDNKINQLFSELITFDSLVDDDLRSYKKHFKFFYDGSIYPREIIYNFLNRLFRPGTYGNSNCCYFTEEELMKFMSDS